MISGDEPIDHLQVPLVKDVRAALVGSYKSGAVSVYNSFKHLSGGFFVAPIFTQTIIWLFDFCKELLELFEDIIH